MANGSNDKQKRYRVFNCLQYEVNPKTGQSLNFNENNILRCVAHKSVTRYAYIRHDKDTVTEQDIETGRGQYDENDLGQPKGAHWHIVIECEKTPLPVSTIAKWLGIPEQMIDIPRGRGSFIDCVEYLRHSDHAQRLNGKHVYDESEVKANFEWDREVELLVARKTRYEKPLNEYDFVRNEVLYKGKSLEEVQREYPTFYQEKLQILKNLRTEYLLKYAEVPPFRTNFYIEGNSGYGKDTMAYSIARSLFPDRGDNAYFEVGANKVTFDGYDGQPVIIWSEFRADTFVETLGGYEQVLSTMDIIPKRSKREHKKYGSVRLINSVNIVTSTQPFKEFLKGLVDRLDPDPTQANRRFPIWIKIRREDFDIAINTGYLNASSYKDYLAYKCVKGSYAELARKLSSRPELFKKVEEKLGNNIISAHEIISKKITNDSYENVDEDDILSNFENYGSEKSYEELYEEFNDYLKRRNEALRINQYDERYYRDVPYGTELTFEFWYKNIR